MLLHILLLITPCALYGQANTIENFSWLVGKWQLTENNLEVFEEWKFKGDELVGCGFTQTPTRSDTTEYLIIKSISSKIVYIASPVNQFPTLFNLTALSDTGFVFENTEHDFPQKIIYKYMSNDAIQASVEGYKDNKFLRLNFYFTRIEE